MTNTTDDAALISYVSKGWRAIMVMAAEAKAVLAQPIPVGERLRILELLTELTDPYSLPQAALAAIKPGDKIFRRMFEEARGAHLEDIVADNATFLAFAKANPSLLDAIRLSRHAGQ